MAIDAHLKKINPLAFTDYDELKSLEHQLHDMRNSEEYPYPLIVCSESRMIPDEEYQFRPLIMTLESLRHSQEHPEIDDAVIADIPALIRRPIAVVRSWKSPRQFVIFVERMTSSGHNVTVAIHCNAHHAHMQVNRIATVVAREKEEDFFENTLRRLSSE